MVKKPLQIEVFKLDNEGNFDNIGQINQYTTLMWSERYTGYASFEINAPITIENSQMFQKGNILWLGGDTAAIIEIIKSTIDNNGNRRYNVKGRTLDALLSDRVIWGAYNGIDKNASTIIYEIVSQSCISPSNELRKIPFLELAIDEQIGNVISFQQTGGIVYDAVFDIATESGLGFDIIFDPRNKKLIFKVIKGVDRTNQQRKLRNVAYSVEFNTDTDDIITSEYYLNMQDYKNIALVAGEGEEVRTMNEAGDLTLSGFSRKEIYIEARDLLSKTVDENGVETVLTPSQYLDVLLQRGNEYLTERYPDERFEGDIRTEGIVQYVLGVDYNKGDLVTVVDKRLGVSMSARITEIEYTMDEILQTTLVLGNQVPTVLQKIKRITQ